MLLNSIWDDIKREFQFGNMVTKILLVNAGFFIFIHLVRFIMVLYMGLDGSAQGPFDTFLEWFMASASGWHMLTRPWTLFSYMFLHEGLWHFVFNMLVFFWFGKILKDFGGNHRVLPVYVLGGLAGFIAFFLAANLLPEHLSGVLQGRHILGASAGVMSVVLASAMLVPNYSMHLLLIGPVKLKYIALVMVFLDFIFIDSNTGGHIAHLGGASMGAYFIYALREGSDWSVPFNNIMNRISNALNSLKDGLVNGKKRGPRMAYRNPNPNQPKESPRDKAYSTHQEKVDAILEKIKRSGYDSLSEEEKEYLFRASKEQND